MIAKRIIAGVLAAVLVLSMTACGSIKLSDAYDEAVVTAKVEEIVGYINDADYAAVAAMARPDIADKLTADIIGAAIEGELANKGSFREIKQVAVGGTQSNGNDYAFGVAVCVHESGSIRYAITFDTDLSIAGFYIK